MTNDETEITVKVTVGEVECGCGAKLTYAVNADFNDDLLISVNEHVCEQEEGA